MGRMELGMFGDERFWLIGSMAETQRRASAQERLARHARSSGSGRSTKDGLRRMVEAPAIAMRRAARRPTGRAAEPETCTVSACDPKVLRPRNA